MRTCAFAAGMAAVVAAILFQYGLTVQALSSVAFACMAGAALLTDIDALVIPNRLIVAGIVCWAATIGFVPAPQNGFGVGSLFVPFFGQGLIAVLADSLSGAFAVAGLVVLAAVVTGRVTGRPALGGGDVKLLFVTGLYLGLLGNVLTLFLSCILGLLIAPMWQYAEKRRLAPPLPQPSHYAQQGSQAIPSPRHRRDKEGSQQTQRPRTFPFGPAIALAAMTALLAGPSLMAQFLGLA